jgi:hypothetical protein
MQLDPKKIKFFTFVLNDPWIILFWIDRLSYINSPRNLLLALIPPTFPEQIITASGLILRR